MKIIIGICYYFRKIDICIFFLRRLICFSQDFLTLTPVWIKSIKKETLSAKSTALPIGKLEMLTDTLKVRHLSGKEFSGIKETWNTLLNLSDSSSFFLKWEWCFAFWRARKDSDAELLVYLFYHESKLVGLAPLYQYKCSLMEVPVVKIAFLGNEVAGDFLDIFTLRGYEHSCCKKLVQMLKANHRYTLVMFESITKCSNIYQYLRKSTHHKNSIDLFFFDEAPSAELSETEDDFFSSLSAQTRYAIKRKERKLFGEVDQINVYHEPFNKQQELLTCLFDLHSERWQVLKKSQTNFSSDFTKKFHFFLLGLIASEDGYFSYIQQNGIILSIAYTFHYNKKYFYYQLGWNPVFQKYSVGFYTIYSAICYAIKHKGKVFDMLRGNEAYKYKITHANTSLYTGIIWGQSANAYVLRFLLRTKKKLAAYRSHFKKKSLFQRRNVT